MRVDFKHGQLEVRLALWQKILGLLGDITVSQSQITAAEVLENPTREIMRIGLKVGLRIPWFYYVCRTIRLDQAWIVRRGTPALAVTLRHHPTLERLVVSTPDASALAEVLKTSRDPNVGTEGA